MAAPRPVHTLRIPIDALDLPHSRPVLSQDQVWLANRFEEDGINREGHPIPALISSEALSELLEVQARYVCGTFEFPVQVPCLHGQLCVAAVRSLLPLREQWWTIDIYTQLTEKQRDTFIEGMFNVRLQQEDIY